MGEETKHIKIYASDYEALNVLMGKLQASLKKRLSFADVVHLLMSGEANPELLETMGKEETTKEE